MINKLIQHRLARLRYVSLKTLVLKYYKTYLFYGYLLFILIFSNLKFIIFVKNFHKITENYLLVQQSKY